MTLWERFLLSVMALAVILLPVARGSAAEPDPGAAPVDTSLIAAPPDSGASAGLTPEERISELYARLQISPRDAGIYNTLGTIYAERQEWAPARDAFISAVQLNPREPEFHKNLALVFVHLETFDLAISELAAYQKLDPHGGLDAARLMGEAYRQVGQREKAKEAFTSALKHLPSDRGDERMLTVLALADLAGDANAPDEARATLEQHLDEARRLIAEAAQARDSTAAEPARELVARLLNGYIGDANRLAAANRPAEAAAAYARALELAPAREDVLAGIVENYLAAGERDKAREVARRATEDHPEVPGAWLAAGRVAEDAGDLPEAIRDYEQALAAGDTRPELKVRLGSLCLKVGDSASARRYLADVASAPDSSPGTLYNYAVSLIREQKPHLALGPLRRAVKLDPGMVSAWIALASNLQQLEQFGEAADAYRRAIALGADAKLSYNLGVCLNRLERRDEAIAAFQEAVKLDPTFKEAYGSLGRALLEVDRYADAAVALEAAQQLDPEVYSTAFALGLCRYHQGEFQKAIDSYNRALALKETSAAMQNLGLAFDKLDRKDEAAKCYAQAKKLKAAGQ
ncbi:MAG: tetratricopeptide repeat protein [Candidatus Krumholzibacteriia bacterium]